MKSNDPDALSTSRLERWERRIPREAKQATDAARERAFEAGLDVWMVRDGKLLRVHPGGKSDVMGTAPQRVRKESRTYKLEWTPRPRG